MWRPGVSGNPKGAAKGSRRVLTETFLKALADDFEENGKEAIAIVRETRPQDYLKVIAMLMPKQAELRVDNHEHMDDIQLRAAINSAIRDLAALGVDIGQPEIGGTTIEGESSRVLSPISETA